MNRVGGHGGGYVVCAGGFQSRCVADGVAVVGGVFAWLVGRLVAVL